MSGEPYKWTESGDDPHVDADADQPDWPSMARERPGPGRPPRFSHDSIVTASVALVAAGGLRDFSMRKLAESIDTTPTTIYRHIDSYDDLVVDVCDAILGEIAIPPMPNDDEIAPWLRNVVGLFRTQMLAHRGVAEQLLLTGPSGPHGLAAMAAICAVIARTGKTATEVAWSYDWLMTTASVYVAKEQQLIDAGGAERVAGEFAKRARSFPDDDFAAVVRSFTGDMSAAFDRTTTAVIAAIVDRDTDIMTDT